MRADLLPAANGEKVRELLKRYLDQRMLFYKSRDAEELCTVKCQNRRKLQTELWNAVKVPAEASQTAVSALTIIGNERCAEFAGVYASGMVEPDTDGGVGTDVGHRGSAAIS